MPFVIKTLLKASRYYVTSSCHHVGADRMIKIHLLQAGDCTQGRCRGKNSPASLAEPVLAPILASPWRYAYILAYTCFGTGLCEAPVMPLDVSNRGGFYFQHCSCYRAGQRVNYTTFFYASTLPSVIWLEDFYRPISFLLLYSKNLGLFVLGLKVSFGQKRDILSTSNIWIYMKR